MALTKEQKKYLVGICHHLQPVVMTGQRGLTERVMAEIDLALDKHELIKVRLRAGRKDRQLWIKRILDHTGAETVQKIGMIACFYKRNTKDPKLELPV